MALAAGDKLGPYEILAAIGAGGEMTILLLLIPAALAIGGLGLAAFFWALRNGQFDDPEGNASRILMEDEE